MSSKLSLKQEVEIAREDLQRAVAAARAGEEPWQEVRRALGVVESLVVAQVKLAEAAGEDAPVLKIFNGLLEELRWRVNRGFDPLPEDLPEEVMEAIRRQVGREEG